MAEKYFCYCIGGTGARIAEVAAHLCAMNMVEANEEITFVIVDKDSECGGTIQAMKTVENISTLSKLPKSQTIDNATTVAFCKNTLTKADWNFTDALSKVCNGTQNAELEEALKHDVNDELIMKAFFDKEARETDTEKGFYGKPAVGSAIFERMLKQMNNAQEDILNPIQLNPNDTAKVFVIGSIFGGTGAAIFSNLAEYIRAKFKERALISGVLLLPYFDFNDKEPNAQDATPTIESDEFYRKSYIALEQYSQNENLMRQNEGGSFDSLYICGQEPLHKVGNYSNGGKGQKNHFDLVDLIAADAMVDFFNKNDFYDDNNKAVNRGKIYEYRFTPVANAEEITTVTGTNIGELADNLNKMLRLVTFLFCNFIAQFVISEKEDGNKCDNVYEHVRCFQDLFTKNEFRESFERIVNDMRGFIPGVKEYCKDYVRFIYDISKTGYDFPEHKQGCAGSYCLFDQDSKDIICELNQMSLLVDDVNNADALKNSAGEIEKTEKKMIKGNKNFKSIKKITDALTDKLHDSNFNCSFAERLGAYVHEAIKVCFE